MAVMLAAMLDCSVYSRLWHQKGNGEIVAHPSISGVYGRSNSQLRYLLLRHQFKDGSRTSGTIIYRPHTWNFCLPITFQYSETT